MGTDEGIYKYFYPCKSVLPVAMDLMLTKTPYSSTFICDICGKSF